MGASSLSTYFSKSCMHTFSGILAVKSSVFLSTLSWGMAINYIPVSSTLMHPKEGISTVHSRSLISSEKNQSMIFQN